jgi:hypothetical protein
MRLLHPVEIARATDDDLITTLMMDNICIRKVQKG